MPMIIAPTGSAVMAAPPKHRSTRLKSQALEKLSSGHRVDSVELSRLAHGFRLLPECQELGLSG